MDFGDGRETSSSEGATITGLRDCRSHMAQTAQLHHVRVKIHEMLGTCNDDINEPVEETLVCTHITSTMSGTLTTLPFPTFFAFHREDLDVFARDCAAGFCFVCFFPGAPQVTWVGGGGSGY